jgi:choline dehydrogenase-like flavoprotein
MGRLGAAELVGDRTVTVDVVIVGTGPGGAAAGRVLAESGARVAWIEEGPKQSRFRANQAHAQRFHFQEGGAIVALGSAYMPVAAGRGVGGGSLVNSALSFRAPDYVLDEWASLLQDPRFSAAAAADVYDEVSALIGVTLTPEDIGGENNAILVRGAAALGWEGGWAPRNTPGCVGCSLCNVGCPSGGKASMDRNLIPIGERAGAQVYAETKVDRILVEGGRAVGVSGVVRDPDTDEPVGRLTVRADKVVISAGAIGTPRLLHHDGVARQLGPAVGRGLHVHPGNAILGVCDHEVKMWKGATQGAYFHVPDLPGVLPHTFNSPPEVVLLTLTAAGVPAKEAMAMLPRMCGVIVLVSDHGDGVVRATREGRADVRYWFDPGDVERTKQGMIASGRALLAGGARRLFAPVRGLGFYDDVDALAADLDKARMSDFTFYAAHPMATCRMGLDPETSVIGPSGEAHRLPGLYLADASVFPTSLGVNPQLTTMMTATVLARGIAAAG